MKKNLKAMLNRKRIMNATIETLDLKKITDNSELPVEDRLSAIKTQEKNLNEIADVIKVSNFKGKSGVLFALARFLETVNVARETLITGEELTADFTDAKDFFAYRLQNKMCERFFPDDETYIGGRLQRVLNQAKTFKPIIALRLMQAEVLNEIEKYDKAYIFEEDDESLILKSVLRDMGTKDINAFVSPKDAFSLRGSKILSFEEARITDKDVLIIASPKYVRTRDIELAKGENVQNILELDVFDS